MASSWVCQQQLDKSWTATAVLHKSPCVKAKDKFMLERNILKTIGLDFYTVAATNWSQTRPTTALYTTHNKVASRSQKKEAENVTERQTSSHPPEASVKPNDSEDDDDDIGIGSMFD